MLFNSWQFIPFIAIVLGLYYRLPHRGQNVLLLIASYVFYGSWDWRFLILLIFSSCVDWSVTTLMQRFDNEDRVRKRLMLVSLFVNLGLLGFFKYFNFFAESFDGLMAQFGVHTSHFVLRVVLPIGISFYTFQSLSYTIDVYRRQQPVIKSILHVLTFVSYFPQLVAGPIQRAKYLAPQIINPRKVTKTQVREGLWLCLWGAVKKVVIADNVAGMVDQTFSNQVGNGGAMTLMAIIAFTLQIYGDFSGYTDIARGLSKLFGIELPKNFNLPYIAQNPSDFWRRWHISLSTWLRDYLYISFGGNRKGQARTYFNLFMTMAIGGLWHGAAWTYVVWGIYHGVLLICHRFISIDWLGRGSRQNDNPPKYLQVLSICGMFLFTMGGWLLFRATSLQQVQAFVGDIFTNFTWTQAAAQNLFPLVAFGSLLVLVELWIRNEDDPATRPFWKEGAGSVAVAVMVAMLILLAPPVGRSFIYFQF